MRKAHSVKKCDGQQNSKGGGKAPGHGTAAAATPSLGPWKRQPRATGRRELKCSREIQALLPRPPKVGSLACTFSTPQARGTQRSSYIHLALHLGV